MSLSPETRFRTLFRTLPGILKREPQDLLYLLCEGKIIGNNPGDLEKSLSMYGLTEYRCTIHLIFKIPNEAYRYTHNDLLASHNALNYPFGNSSSSARASQQQTSHQTQNPNVQSQLQPPEYLDFLTSVGIINVLQDIYEDVVVKLDLALLESVTSPSTTSSVSTCVICHDEMTDDNNLFINVCRHTFHRDCIVNWLTQHSVLCPTCNRDVRS